MQTEPTVIYLDSSLVLARLFIEYRSPPDSFWQQPLTSSRLLIYEVWSRIHGRGYGGSHGGQAQALLDLVELVEMSPAVLNRALEPFPSPLRTRDALHLASMVYLRSNGRPIELASYDHRLNAAARALGFQLVPL